MRTSFACSVGILCGLVASTTTGKAWALDQYLDLEPPETISGYGYGYNSIARSHTLKKCVSFGTKTIDAGGPSGNVAHYTAVNSSSELADEMDLSVATKYSMSMGVVNTSASSKVGFFQKTKVNRSSLTILANWSGVDPMKYIDGDITLKPEYLAMVGTPAFRANCGDFLVVGMQSGRWLYGTVQVSSESTQMQSQLVAGGAISAEGGGQSGSVDVGGLNKIANSITNAKIDFELVTSANSNNTPKTVKDFDKFVTTFPGMAGAKQIYKLKAVPYEKIIANWPQTNPLAPLTDADKLNVLGEAAWTLVALIDDTDFVTKNIGLFAVGSTPAKRDARNAYLKSRREFYKSQLDAMRNGAKNCDVDWAGTPACESLYNKWKGWEDFAFGEYEQMPIRYVSDCYGAREVTLNGKSAADTITGALAGTKGNFTLANNGADRKIGGSAVSVVAYLDFKPNFSGGDPLATRKLSASLSMKIAEKTHDKTEFKHTMKVDVADLSVPDMSGGGAPVTLNQCAYKNDGVKAELLSQDPAPCELLKQLSPGNLQPYNVCKTAAADNKHHGFLFATEPEGDGFRNPKFTKNVQGVITSLQCTVDGAESDDTGAIGCSSIGLKSIQLELLNKEDLAADKWVQPPPTPLTVSPTLMNAAAVPKGIVAPVGYSTNLRKAQSAGKALAMSKRSNKRAAACSAGLVSVDGECVIKMKR
jgi:hypothetical protein